MKVGVIILNFNGWEDSLACVESVLGSSVRPAWIVIVDNASTNNSVSWFRHWACGDMDFALSELGAPTSCPKPVQLVELTEGETPDVLPGHVVLVRNVENRGYAAGNNVGIRLLMQWGADAVWILNNDTVVEKRALGALTDCLFTKSQPGLCGARVQYYGLDAVQCRAGGKTNPWTGLSNLDGFGFSTKKALLDSAEDVEKRINFIYGASVMASREFIEKVGLLDERYFLYCEEQDWAYRSKGLFDISYAPNAIVYHREGRSTGFSCKKINLRSLWYLVRSRILLTSKHKPWALPTVCLSIVFAAVRMAWRRLVVKTIKF